MKDYSDRIEPFIAEAAPTKTEQTAGKPVPREVNAHYRTLGVAQTATEEELKAARTKAIYDNSLPDDEKLRIRNAYEQIAEYRDNPAAYEAKLAAAAKLQKAATSGNRFKIRLRSVAAVAAIAIGAVVGTAKLMPSDADKAQNAADNSEVKSLVGQKIDDARQWAYDNAPYHAKDNLKWLKPDAPAPATVNDPEILASARMAFMKMQDDVVKNPDKYFGKDDPHKIKHAAELRRVVLEHKKEIFSGEQVEYSLGGTKERSVAFKFNKQAGSLTFATLDDNKKPILTKEIPLGKKAAKPEGKVSAPEEIQVLPRGLQILI